jgi:hypothetical protein
MQNLPISPLGPHPVSWEDVCAYVHKQDEWMTKMSIWADKVDHWFISHNQGGTTPPPPAPPSPRWP